MSKAWKDHWLSGEAKGREEGRLASIMECLQNGTIEDAKRLLKATDEEIVKAERGLLVK